MSQDADARGPAVSAVSQSLHAPSSRKSRVEAPACGLLLGSAGIKQVLEGVSFRMHRHGERLLSCHGQNHARLHHHLVVVLLAISQKHGNTAIEHRFGRHLRLRGLEWHLAFRRAL